MTIKSTNLTWVCVTDFEKSLKFYKETLGFKELSVSTEYGWAELQGEDGGSVVGLAKKDPSGPIAAGQNGVITLTVDKIEDEIARLQKIGVKLVGELQEVPGHVKMQMLLDDDGNHLQLVELL
ncbi:MAG: VOC family protein [Chlamydiae bacterium]|nr:hypothetical protein [Chlamydiales bacterium]MCH9704217.1 VOC family protein [Chlamydiota bacterium]